MIHRAIVLLSGGMDSLVTAAIALRDNKEVSFMHVNYGQKTEAKEMECFTRLCEFYHQLNSHVINMDWLGQIGGSALTDDNIKIEDYKGNSVIPATYVPFRNANLISAAVSLAEVLKVGRIYIGAVEEDSSGYPDCREIFFQSIRQTITTGSKQTPPIEVVTPLIHMSKSDIVKLGNQLQVPFEYSWSCYKNSELACGVCDSCVIRFKAFKAAGISDPIPYSQRNVL